MLLYLYLYCIKIFFFPTVFDCSFTFCLACLCGCNYGFCLYWTGMSLSSFFKKMLFYVLSNHKVKFFLSRHKIMSLLQNYQKFTILLCIIFIIAVELFALSASCSLSISWYNGARENAQDCKLVAVLQQGCLSQWKVKVLEVEL